LRSDFAQFFYLDVVIANCRVACHAQAYCRYRGGGAVSHITVAKCAVQAQTLHLLSLIIEPRAAVDVEEDVYARVDGVREGNWLGRTLVGPKDDRASEPGRDDEGRDQYCADKTCEPYRADDACQGNPLLVRPLG
jgi:hypothetical protein